MRQGCTQALRVRRACRLVCVLVCAAVTASIPIAQPRRSASAAGDAEAVDELRSRPVETLTNEQVRLVYPDQVEAVAVSFGIDLVDAAQLFLVQGPAGQIWEFAQASDPAFGGAWFEWGDDGVPTLVVGYARGIDREGVTWFDVELHQIVEDLGVPFEHRAVDHTYQELVDATIELNERLSELHVPGTFTVAMSERTRSLFVEGVAIEERSIATSREGAPPLPIDNSLADHLRTPDTVIGGGWLASGGGSQCTMNFAYVKPDGSSAVGTTGHCSIGQPSFNGVTVGSEVSGYTNLSGYGIDRQFHPVPSPHSTDNQLELGNTANTNIYYESPGRLIVGSAVNIHGGNGVEECGRANVVAMEVEQHNSWGQIRYRSPNPIPDTDPAANGRQPIDGDSGSPLFFANTAVGVHEGGASGTSCSQTGLGDGIIVDRNTTDAPGLEGAYFVQTGTGGSGGASYQGVGTYHDVGPTRVIDSRNGGGKICAGQTARLVDLNPFTNDDVNAVSVNVTFIPDAGASGQVHIYPVMQGTTYDIPTSAAVGQYESSLGVTATSGFYRVAVSDDLALKAVAGSSGCTHFIVDLFGYTSGAQGTYGLANGKVFVATPQPIRTYDSRSPGNQPLGAGQTRYVKVSDDAGVPANATTVAVNLTAIYPTAATVMAMFPWGASHPSTSNLNPLPGQVVNGFAPVKVGSSNGIAVHNAFGTVDFTVDILGWWTSPTSHANNNGRVNFSGSKLICNCFLGGNGQLLLDAAVLSDPFGPSVGVQAALLNLTAYNPSGPGHLYLTEGPNVTATGVNLNYQPGLVSTTGTIVSTASNGNFYLTNGTNKNVWVEVEVTGWIHE